MLSLSHKLALDQLKSLSADIRLVVIHPNYVGSRLLFAALLDESNLAYVRFDGSRLTAAQLREQLGAALEAQGVARVKDLRYLLLDELDNADEDELEGFLGELAEQVSKGKLLLVSRALHRFLLKRDRLRRLTRFVPFDEQLMLWDYAQRNAEESALLEVRALGRGRVLLNGEEVDNWDGILPRSLFFFLVDKGMTTRNDIFQTFWPSLSVREATNVFHVTKRKISEVLGIDLTSYWSGFYHISNAIELSYDVVNFSEMFQSSALASADEEDSLLRRAISLYRDNYLTSMQMDWVIRRRGELRQTYGEALIGLAKSLERRNLKPDALGYYLRAFTTNPLREDITGNMMLLYRDLGLPQDGLKVYERLKAALEENLTAVAPDRRLQELADELRQEAVRVR